MTNNSRVAIYIPCLMGGGAEHAMFRLADGLVRTGVAVDFLVANSTAPSATEVPANLARMPPNVKLIDFKSGQPRSSVKPLVAYLQHAQPTALISFGHNANVVAILARRLAGVTTRNVLSIQNNYSAEVSSARSFHVKLMLLCARVFYRFADVVTAVSQGVADDMAVSFHQRKDWVKVIYNPIVSDELLQKSYEIPDHPFFSDDQVPVILSVGRLHMQKDYGILIRAFSQVRAKRRCRLIILGEGGEREALQNLISDLQLTDDVSMPGYAANPYAYMGKATLFVLSSIFEGLPTVLIEAMACGCPVVSTDCPSGPMEILEGGKWGTLVPMKDIDAMANAIEESLARPKVAPPQESWMPYTTKDSVAAYSRVIHGYTS